MKLTDDMIEAGKAYLKRLNLNEDFRLPGGFNWHLFWDILLAAHPDSPPRPYRYIAPTPLKGCPLCGAQPREIAHVDCEDGFDILYTIRCDTCAIEVSDEYHTKVIELWNTRPAAPTKPCEFITVPLSYPEVSSAFQANELHKTWCRVHERNASECAGSNSGTVA